MRLASVIVVCALARTSTAGRTRYGALHDTEVQVERNVEIASWIYEDNEDGGAETRWATGPFLGFDDQLELGFPVEFATTGDTTAFDRYGAELRYRLVPASRSLAPLVRVAVNRVVSNHRVANLQGDFAVSYAAGRLHVLVDAGVSSDVGRHGVAWTLHPGVGTSIRVAGDLRIGAEAFGEIALEEEAETGARAAVAVDESEESWIAVGPNVAWTHGRFWLSACYGIGVVGIDSAPRLQWGVAF